MIRTKRIVLLALCAAVALLLWPSSGAAQILGPLVNFGFAVDSGPGITRGNAIAVDSKNVYFAYYNLGDPATPPTVRYEAFPLVVSCPAIPCAFVPPKPSTVDVIGPPTPAQSLFAYSISIAIDPQGNPHIFYQAGLNGMRHATLVPGVGWVHEDVPLAAGLYSSMAIDKNGTVHVADGPISPSGIGYAAKSNGVWATDFIIGPSNAMSALSLAVDSQGMPQVAWADHRSTFNELVYARRGTGPIFWNSGNAEIVSPTDAEWVSLAVDKNDVPSVSYWGWQSGFGDLTAQLTYASKQSFGFWPAQLVDSFSFPCCFSFPWLFHMTSLALSPSGIPRISYAYDYNPSAGAALARLDSFFWDKQPLDSDPTGGFTSTSLVIDRADISHVLYVTSSNLLIYERISNANTPVGFPVTVNLGDPASDGSPITVTFPQVTQAGLTSVSMADPRNGPAPPANFQLGNPPVYYDFSTTAVFRPPATVCIPYGNVSNPSSLELMHDENGVWVNRTVSNDPLNHRICANVNSFSLLAIFEGQTLIVCAPDVSSSVSVTRSGYSYSVITKRYAQIVTLTNTSGSPISGPIYFAVDNLSGTASLHNAAGKTGCVAPTGSPYVSVPGPLDAGAHTTAVLQFTDPTNTAISYTPRVLAGAGQP
jgi:hypothetical protein